MKNKATALMMVALVGLVAGCNQGYIKVSDSPYKLLNGKLAKKSYESYSLSGIASLNYLQSSAAANAQHFTNFVDGLLTHNDFGTLELNLAESAEHNPDYSEFSFKVRHDEHLYWSTFDGSPYTVEGQVQYVTAEDFVTAAKIVSNYSFASDTFYLMRDFISGSLEYYLLTEVRAKQEEGIPDYTKLSNDALVADYLNKKIKKEYENVYYDGEYNSNPIKGSDIADIESGARFGVHLKEGDSSTVVYTLMKGAVYFPTLLTYSCYLPVNKTFYAEKGNSFGIARPDSILYNGPFLLNKLDETNIIYKRNEAYLQRADLHGYNTARVETVKYNIPKGNTDSTYSRTQFEAGNIDGFSLSPNDKVGWQKYVVGKKGTGTIEEPANGLVNSRFLDTIGYAYGSNVVVQRTKNTNSWKSYSSFAGGAANKYDNPTRQAAVKNTEKALRLQSVRQAILAAIDYPTYYCRYADGDATSVFATQNLVHTYVPRNFVTDNNGNEYTETYYAEALAAKRGITLEQAQAAIKPGQWDSRQLSQDVVTQKVNKALADIAAYNADTAFNSEYDGTISFPINIEYFSLWYDQETCTYDSLMIEEMNKRLNGISYVEEDFSNCQYFRVIPTDEVTEKNYSTVDGQNTGGAAFDFSVHMWGWGADYGDPLTYLNTYTKGGDWSSIFAFLNEETIPNITYDGVAFEVADLLAHYTQTVKDAQQENENLVERYRGFAAAEVELIEELAIYLPQTNSGQGWALSISKAAGYESPTSNYGLSSDRLTGMWVLKKPLKSSERVQLRKEQEEAKSKWVSTHPAYNIYEE